MQKSALLDEACSDAFTYHILFEGIIFIVSDDNSHATNNSSFPIRPRVDMWREYDVPLIEVKVFNLTATRGVFHREKARAHRGIIS